ncbi:MAG: hypothetical protein JXX14_00600 [Deltaproteobacteria bacterium]|nr:hypothetical protein [Deltaproteobacteria bacterium]
MTKNQIRIVVMFSVMLLFCTGSAQAREKGEGKKGQPRATAQENVRARRATAGKGMQSEGPMAKGSSAGNGSPAENDAQGKHKGEHGKRAGEQDSADDAGEMHGRGHRGEQGKMAKNTDRDGDTEDMHGKRHAYGRDKEPGEGLKQGERRDRRVRVAELKKKHEGKKAHVDAAKKKQGRQANETKKHLRRMARLKRLMEIAEEKDNGQLKEKVSALMEKETARHEKAMAKEKNAEVAK